jgi:hypothetical protein
MAPWKNLVRFIAAEDGKPYYSPFASTVPKDGDKVQSFASINALEDPSASKLLTVQKVRKPVRRYTMPLELYD